MSNRCIFVFFILILAGCEDSFSYKDFSSNDIYKNETDFNTDSSYCESVKDKHSYKIQGRELGFEGQNTSYLGCMKLKGWRLGL